MRQQTQLRVQPASRHSVGLSASPCFLQRKCACGGSGGKDDECEECKKEGGAMLQRRSLSRRSTDDGSPHSHQSPHSPETTGNLSFGGLRATVALKSSAISASRSVQETGFTVNAPNDRYEQEADRVSQEVMNMPEGAAGALIAPKLGIQRLASATNSCVALRHKSHAEEDPTSVEIAPPVTPQVEAGIRRAPGGGEPLPVSEREFFEPRFGYDFSKVRIHGDAQAASLANAVDASAFTLGQNIFFNTGCYQPSSPSGRRLLAHELTHVVQQEGAGDTSQVLQLARISYTQLAWGDYKGRAPAKSPHSAWTFTDVGDFKDPVPKPDVKDSEKTCKIGKKDTTEFTATVAVDPALFDGVLPFMIQEKSWVRDRYRDDGKVHCVGVVKDCEASFDKEAAQAKKSCQKHVAACEKAFKKGSGSLTLTINSKDVTASNKADCATTFFEQCQKLTLQDRPFALSTASEPDYLKVDTKKECKTQGSDQCLHHEKQESENLLKHEQGHFDITKVMAEHLQSALLAKAAELTATETKCGKEQAIAAALKSFNARKPAQVLQKIDKDWRDQWDKALKAYDKETTHGLKRDMQTTWEGKISEGLKGFAPAGDKPHGKAPAKKAPTHAP